ncbi:N-methylhydantoinase A [Rhodoligotrophos appendicifer]|uniref:hydantoinase/oxoprolinase family protein n=1 Tax=Rhodoligotrophos appendicifer TaxID=987056 RepID=UPI001184D037|nr:hydantoinase/oxoprolinase family protein [Rhodoligotrophos appendicifer]
MYYLGVDTGGTFTDFVLFDHSTASISTFKIRSTPHDPGEAVERGLERLKDEYGVTGENLARLIFGTTVATNAVLEGRGAKTALVATQGTRDVLEIQRQWRHRLFDLYLTKPAPLAARRHRVEIAERVTASGDIHVALTDDAIDGLVDRLSAMAVESVAVSLLFSFLRPDHERRIAKAISTRLPHLHVSISSEISPEFREYERSATTVMNAYTMPKIHALAMRLEQALERFGFRGQFAIVQSNGGVMSLAKARSHPVNTLLSGPAAGVVAAAALGRLGGVDTVLGFDVGGTSTDIALVEDGEVRLSAEGGIGGYPVKVPQVRVHTIGAGGGSIARPELGLLKVGPQSAGAMPGPVAYGNGGTEPTGTDAAVALGYIDPAYFLGGEMALDREAARHAIAEKVAGPLKLGIDAAALAIIKVQVANIVSGIRKVSVDVGKDPRGFALMPFGGAGGIYAGAVAVEAGMSQIILPPHASVLSALGMLLTDIRHDRVKTRLMALAETEPATLASIFDGLKIDAAGDLERDQIDESRVAYEFSCDMRYEGQAYEINVRLPVEGAQPRIEMPSLRQSFDHEHERLYGQCSPSEPVEIVNLRLGAIGRVEKASLPRLPASDGRAPAPRTSRSMLFDEVTGWIDCPVYDRDGLAPGMRLVGPAVIEDRGASIPLLPDHEATVDDWGIIFIDTKATQRKKVSASDLVKAPS